jgi:hypothetical protein
LKVRRLLLGGCAAAALAASGCTVGSGSGCAVGMLYEVGCAKLTSSPPGALVPYSLKPVFFAGEPIEDLTMTSPIHMNQLRMRLQDNGLAIQYADVLGFDVETSYQVARCLRGRVNADGTPDWNVTETLPDGTRTWWCDWSGIAVSDGGAFDASAITPGGPDAGTSLDGGVSMMATYPRIHLTPYTDLRASLATLSTCGITNIVGVANDGWVQFQNFGSAEQPDRAPMDRDPVPGNFVIQFGERMQATFYMTLTDQAIIGAMEQNLPPPEQAQIGGYLRGKFDFNLERGRSAQPFP